MRALIVGLGASGTSYYAQLADRMGWRCPRPHKGRMPFDTFESRDGREINETLLARTKHIYDPGLSVPLPSKTLIRKAQRFINSADQSYTRWMFKDPRSTVTYHRLWRHFNWDLRIFVYRNPAHTLASILKWHVADTKLNAADLERMWMLWTRHFLDDADVHFIRFPGDESRLAALLGTAIPKDTAFDDSALSHDPAPIPDWAQPIWAHLERRRDQIDDSVAGNTATRRAGNSDTRSGCKTSPTGTQVAVVIVTHNAAPWLERCIGSCRCGGRRPLVVVVDNNSHDNSLEIAHQCGALVIPQTGNLGFGVANNIGIREALKHGAAGVFLMNQDAYLLDDALERLFSISGRRSEFGILSPLQLQSDERQLDPVFAQHLPQDCSHMTGIGAATRDTDEVWHVGFTSAAGWLITARCVEMVGGFDPLFFMYGEDVDFCRRAQNLGFAIGVAPGARLVHLRTGDSRGERNLINQINHNYVRQVLDLKRVDRPLVLAALSVMRASVGRTTTATVTGNPQQARAELRALLRTASRLGAIHGSRRRCDTVGAHWLHDSGRNA